MSVAKTLSKSAKRQPGPTGKKAGRTPAKSALPVEDSAFELPTSRVDAFERLKSAMSVGDSMEVAHIAEWFGEPAPVQIQLTGLARELAQKNSSQVHKRLAIALDAAKKGHAFNVAASSFRGEFGEGQFADLSEKFKSTGEAFPKVSDALAYFTSPANAQIHLAIDLPRSTRAAVFHFSGYVHSGASDHFFLSFLHDNERRETLRLGTHGITFENERSFLEMRGAFPRLFSIVASETLIAIYVNGFCLWRQVRGGGVPRTLELILDQNAAGSGDAVMNGFELWTSGEPVADLFQTSGDYDASESLAWQMEQFRPAEVARMIRAIEPLDLRAHEAESLEFMRRCVEGKGYLEWAVEAVRPNLSDSAQAQWQKIKTRALPVPVIDVKHARVELMRNPAKSLLLTNLLFRRGDNMTVLDDISFAIYPGDVIGIIGHNGAGKSTLLRAMAGLIPIKNGSIRIADKFMLLRGGIGVRPELTGRQNVLSAGIYMGLTPREARLLIPDVLEVSGLGEHFDRPVKYYSDGMMSRLVFSIATSVSPTVLLLDELLGAGDISFQETAKKRLNSFLSGSNVVVVVTHSIDFVRNNCNKALVLSHGKQIYFGEPKTAVAAYLTDLDMALSKKETEGRF